MLVKNFVRMVVPTGTGKKRGLVAPGLAFILCLSAFSCIVNGGQSSTDDARLQRIEDSLPTLESKVRSTLMFGGSSPVSFYGETRLKLQYHSLQDNPEFMTYDDTYLASNWEGNESMVRLGMIVRAGRNAVLWSKLGFQNTLPGLIRGDLTGSQEWDEQQTRHDKSSVTANIHEDLSAGIAIRTVPASFWLKMGNINWIEASPFTLWKSQPRSFAWDYLPFEIEQPIARYYEYNIALGEKSGRAAWNKKPLNGINLESISLPWDLYADLVYGAYERYDNFEREYIDFSNDLGFADLPTAAKGRGIGDTFRHILLARVARSKTVKDVTVGGTFVRYLYNRDVATTSVFQRVFSATTSRRGFFKEPTVGSLDLRGAVSENLSIQADVALSQIDTTHVRFDSAMSLSFRSSYSDVKPAIYGQVASMHLVPVKLEAVYAAKGFYSPLSFVAPNDAFFPFGTNLVGAGKFLARGEASPYVQNMAGARLSVAPKLKGYGHLRFGGGMHFQPETGQDVLYFPYRLNGQDLFGLFQSSYNRWGNGLIDHSIPGAAKSPYKARLGDQSFRTSEYNNPYGPEAGGLRSDYLGMYESFVPYESQAQADSNLHETTTVFTRSQFVPHRRKWTHNVELDAAYDIGPLLHYRRDALVGGYASYSSVSASANPAEESLLWSLYARLEPSIALTDKFYLLGLVGWELWRSDDAYTADSTGHAVKSPVDFRDKAVGVGFDWEMASRVGLHGRCKWMRHEDTELTVNNWSTPVVSAEVKMWF